MPSGRDGGLTPRARPARRSATGRSPVSRQIGLSSARRSAGSRLQEPAARRATTSPRKATRPRKSGRFSRVSRFDRRRSRRRRRFRSTDPCPPLGERPWSTGRTNRSTTGTASVARFRAKPARGSPSAPLRSGVPRGIRLTATGASTLAGVAPIRSHPPVRFPLPSPCDSGACLGLASVPPTSFPVASTLSRTEETIRYAPHADNNIREDRCRFLCMELRILNIRYTMIHSVIPRARRRGRELTAPQARSRSMA